LERSDGAQPDVSRSFRRSWWLLAGCCALAVVVVVAELLTYRWRAMVNSSAYPLFGGRCAVYQCAQILARSYWIATHRTSTRSYDLLVMAARQCVVAALVLAAVAWAAPAAARQAARFRQVPAPGPAEPALSGRLAGLVLACSTVAAAGAAGGLASAILQHPIPGEGVPRPLLGVSAGWPWYLSSNLLLGIEASLAVAIALGLAARSRRPAASQRPTPGTRQIR
jgi:hypothetical protein